MGARTGDQYLAALNARTPHVVVDGEIVRGDVGSHPAFRDNARTYARLFDLQHDPEHRDALTHVSPGTGERVHTSFLVPRDESDLRRRRAAFEVWARASHGFLGRSGDFLNSALTALSSAEGFFTRAGERYAERIRAYYEFVRDNDLLAAHTLVPPQVNRSVSASQQGGGSVAARVVEERADGIVVRGARMLATLGSIADELLVFPSTMLRGGPDDAAYSYAFAVPSDAPGLKFYARTSFYRGTGPVDEPLASRFEESDAVVVFDDVVVPHERVFLLGDPALCNAFYTDTGAGALMAHQVFTRTLAKTEFYLGLASTVADAIGIGSFQHIQEDLGELICYVELGRAVLRASEVEGSRNDEGVFLPRWETLNAARNWYPRTVSVRLPEIIRKFSASGLMALPGERDLANPEARADIDTYLQAAMVPAEDRVKLFKLALDASVSGFAGRESLYEYFFYGDPVRMAGALVSSYDLEPYRRRVAELLNDVPEHLG